MQDSVGRSETVKEGKSKGNYEALDIEEDVSIRLRMDIFCKKCQKICEKFS